MVRVYPERDEIRATTETADAYDRAYHRAQQSQVAQRNPVHRCEACGAWVRLGARGGLWDVVRRTAHHKLCGRDDRPSEADLARMRAMSASSTATPTVHGDCVDCGFALRHCRC